MKKFTNKLVFITGGSSGIGLAASREFLSSGARVLLISRNETKLKTAVEKLVLDLGVKIRDKINICSLDITKNAEVKNILSDQVKTIGIPDLLVNCAGMAYPDYFEQISFENYDKTMSVNITGTWNVLSALVPVMLKGSHIVNTSSIGGFIGVFGFTAYSASKFAVMGMSEALRAELKPRGIGISVLCPPDTDTPGMVEENRTKPEETHAVSGNVKLMSPEKVAEALLKGIKKNKFIIIPGLMGKFSFLMKRLFPSLVFAIMDSDVTKIKNTREKNIQ